jgi:D-methionine transport system substrate-binding protein
MKKFWLLPSSLLIVSILIVGEALARGPAKAELKVGFVSGPYIDEFKAGIEPELKQKGYAIRYFEFRIGSQQRRVRGRHRRQRHAAHGVSQLLQ